MTRRIYSKLISEAQMFAAVVLLLATTLALMPAQVAYSEVDPSEIERLAMQYRESHFDKGSVSLHVQNFPASRPADEFDLCIQFDGESIRYERINPAQSYDCRIIANGQFIHRFNQNPQLALVIERSDQYERLSPNIGVFHPRSLGMSTTGIQGLYRFGLQDLLSRKDRSDVTLTEDQIRGLATYRLDYVLNNGTRVSVWICPEQGYGVLRAQSTSIEGNGNTVCQATETELEVYEPGKLWFPKRCEYIFTANDKVLDRQIVTVAEAKFDSVDPDVFTITGMKLPVGQIINDHTRKYFGQLRWDGSNIVGGK